MKRCCSILFACCLWSVTASNAILLLVPTTHRQPGGRQFLPSRRAIKRRRVPSFLSLSSSTNTHTADVEDEIRSMRVKELQRALPDLNISTKDVFEKEELVQRLLTARIHGAATPSTTRTTMTTASASSQHKKGSTTALVAPLYFTTMDANMKVAAVNIDGGITINSNSQPYATMQIFVRPNSSTSQSSSLSFSLRLLLDTACSGFVLKPSVVQQYNLPQLSTPVTMTGAGGGTTGATGGLTQLDKFFLHENDNGNNYDYDDSLNKVFGPLPAAVQDIGALPSSLDGIIGLSFLNKFAGVELDFQHGKLSLYQSWPPPSRSSPTDDGHHNHDQPLLVGRDTLQTVSHLGIYTTNVYLGSRGPVKMLVDTGAANTFLSWKGVADLGLSRDSTDFIQRLKNPMGAMGSDNVVMQLTHRIYVGSKLCIGDDPSSSSSSQKVSLPGLSLEGQKRLAIDIGDIAILEQLNSQGIGGILGIDALMRCSRVRLRLQGPEKILELYSGDDGSKGP